MTTSPIATIASSLHPDLPNLRCLSVYSIDVALKAVYPNLRNAVRTPYQFALSGVVRRCHREQFLDLYHVTF